MAFVIRPASEKDIPFIIDGMRIIEQKSYVTAPSPLTAERIHKEALSSHPRCFIDIAELEQQPAGFVIYSFCFFASEGEGIWVTSVYVDPFCRKSGIGKEFVDHIRKKYPQASGIYGSIARTNNIARHFFSRLGATRYDDYIIYGVERGHP